MNVLSIIFNEGRSDLASRYEPVGMSVKLPMGTSLTAPWQAAITELFKVDLQEFIFETPTIHATDLSFRVPVTIFVLVPQGKLQRIIVLDFFIHQLFTHTLNDIKHRFKSYCWPHTSAKDHL